MHLKTVRRRVRMKQALTGCQAGRGVSRGRKRALSPAQVADLCQRAAGGEHKADPARAFGISRETL